MTGCRAVPGIAAALGAVQIKISECSFRSTLVQGPILSIGIFFNSCAPGMFRAAVTKKCKSETVLITYWKYRNSVKSTWVGT